MLGSGGKGKWIPLSLCMISGNLQDPGLQKATQDKIAVITWEFLFLTRSLCTSTFPPSPSHSLLSTHPQEGPMLTLTWFYSSAFCLGAFYLPLPRSYFLVSSTTLCPHFSFSLPPVLITPTYSPCLEVLSLSPPSLLAVQLFIRPIQCLRQAR